MLCTLAAAERDTGDLKASEAAAREALRVAPDFWDAYVELAKTLETAGRLREAREAFQAVLDTPGFDLSYKGNVLREMERLANREPDR